MLKIMLTQSMKASAGPHLWKDPPWFEPVRSFRKRSFKATTESSHFGWSLKGDSNLLAERSQKCYGFTVMKKKKGKEKEKNKRQTTNETICLGSASHRQLSP